jgi:hypothetical protein
MNTTFKSKEEAKQAFLSHFNLTEKDFKTIHKLFLSFGMSKGEADYRSHENHSYLQLICENFSVDYDAFSKGITPKLKKILHKDYPQLLVQNKNYAWCN